MLSNVGTVVMGALLRAPAGARAREFCTAPPAILLPAFRDWDSLPDLLEHPFLDVRSVASRLAVFKCLIEHTAKNDLVGQFREHQIWWGYASQLCWQRDSGRLNPLGPPGTVAADSWWGKMNYSLCIVPLQAAINVGVLPAMVIRGDEFTRQERERTYARAILKWEKFFQELARGGGEGALRRLEHMAWDAHMASLSVAKDVAQFDFRRMNNNEQRFARGWVRLVRVLDSVDMPTDLLCLSQVGSLPLPPRRLGAHEIAGRAEDFTPAQNTLVKHLVEWGSTPRIIAYPAQWCFDRMVRILEGGVALARLRSRRDGSPAL